MSLFLMCMLNKEVTIKDLGEGAGENRDKNSNALPEEKTLQIPPSRKKNYLKHMLLGKKIQTLFALRKKRRPFFISYVKGKKIQGHPWKKKYFEHPPWKKKFQRPPWQKYYKNTNKFQDTISRKK